MDPVDDAEAGGVVVAATAAASVGDSDGTIASTEQPLLGLLFWKSIRGRGDRNFVRRDTEDEAINC